MKLRIEVVRFRWRGLKGTAIQLEVVKKEEKYAHSLEIPPFELKWVTAKHANLSGREVERTEAQAERKPRRPGIFHPPKSP